MLHFGTLTFSRLNFQIYSTSISSFQLCQFIFDNLASHLIESSNCLFDLLSKAKRNGYYQISFPTTALLFCVLKHVGKISIPFPWHWSQFYPEKKNSFLSLGSLELMSISLEEKKYFCLCEREIYWPISCKINVGHWIMKVGTGSCRSKAE